MLTKLIRNLVSHHDDRYVFLGTQRHDFPWNIQKEHGLYLHIPFCKNLCPYCPYNRITYEQNLARDYLQTLSLEMGHYRQRIEKPKFSSLYIGGGTPTLILEELKPLIRQLRCDFSLQGPVAIETTPSDLDSSKIKSLEEASISYVSLGVQSFKDKYLSLMGRNYDSRMAREASDLLSRQSFALSNIDLIFAFPGQTIDELLEDLHEACAYGYEQVTCYPLFTFPYSAIGRFRNLKKLKMPSLRQRKNMYYTIADFFKKKGYRQSSVWSFNRNEGGQYSSVTRDYYVGLGAGAGSYTGSGFYFNTFSVPAYGREVQKRIPLALEMKVSPTMERLFWLYWRFYETKISLKAYREHFGSDLRKDLGFFLKTFEYLGFFNYQGDDVLVLNKRGAHWIHLLQNYFALNYVNKIWTRCQKEAWPSRIEL